MDCGTCCYDDKFDDVRAERDLRRFRKRGADDHTRVLIAMLREHSLDGASLLDVGGGVGAIQHELLDSGVHHATQADASAAYLTAASEEATRRGHSDRVTFVHGDFVALAPDISPADIVTLDRVICCYADMDALVTASASHAKRVYGAVFPRDRWIVRVGFRSMNWFNRMRGNGFRIYLHSPAAIDAAVARQGLARRSFADTFIWRVAVYAR